MPVVRRLLAALALMLTVGSAGAQVSSSPAGCEVLWQLTPHWAAGGQPTRIELQLAIDGAAPVKQVPADDAPGLLIGPRQLAFAGRALLALPPALAGRASLQMCLQVDGLDKDQRIASSLHPRLGDERLLRWQGPPALAREIVVAIGAWSTLERGAGDHALEVLVPAGLRAETAQALADAAGRAVGQPRQFWGLAAPERGAWLVVLAGNDGTGPPLAMGQHDALLLRLPPASAASTDAVAVTAATELLMAQAMQRGVFRERFGPVAFAPRGDDAPSAWFSDGFSLFYALRLRAAGGPWSVDELADAWTMLWQQGGSPAALPWLAAHWHSALIAGGRAGGLDAVLHRLLLPAKARGGALPFGPLSQPLAPHRLQAALRPLFGEQMRADLQRFAEAGAAPGAASLGPCFEVDAAARRISAARGAASAGDCQAWLGTGRHAAAAAAADAQAPRAAAGKATKTARSARATSSAKAAPAARPAKAAPKRRKR
ncbi:hypothetical protein [Aquabacterium humicola]|uniref:hypothetical protein n=1 Tax=Aquabacterium humicola TaxID=3237377 RepID=UPI002543ACF4|nr:hypothetical protein [Rubrivivax pictus]